MFFLTQTMMMSAHALPPDLTYTEQVIGECFAHAMTAHPSASISVKINGVTAVPSTDDLSAVYGVLGGSVDADLINIISNSAGSAALVAAQICLDNAAPTVGMGRIHQARPDLRHDAEILTHNSTTYSHFDVSASGDVVTFLPDGVSMPTCGEKVHLASFLLSNGDYSVGHTYVDAEQGESTFKVKVKCENESCSGPGGNTCNPVKNAQGFYNCLCSDENSMEDCTGSTEAEDEEVTGRYTDDPDGDLYGW